MAETQAAVAQPSAEQQKIAQLEQQVATLKSSLADEKLARAEATQTAARLQTELDSGKSAIDTAVKLGAELKAEKARLCATATDTGKPLHRYVVSCAGFPDEPFAAVDESEAARLYRLKNPKAADLRVRRLD